MQHERRKNREIWKKEWNLEIGKKKPNKKKTSAEANNDTADPQSECSMMIFFLFNWLPVF